MLSNRLALGALGIACITAAAGGGYLATRQNAVPTPASAAVAEAAPTAAAPVATTEPAAAPVQETEAVVGDAKRAPAAAAPVAAPESKARAASPSRTAAPPARSTRTEAGTTVASRREPPPLERSWPSGSSADNANASGSPSQGNATPEPPSQRVEETAAAEPARAPEPPEKTFEELVVAADSVIGLQTDTSLSSERARVEDRVDAHVTRAVRVNDRIAIPAGTRAVGSVVSVERGGKFKEQARLGIRFNMLVLADGTELPISTETISRVGEAPSSAQKVGGGAIGGAILGAIMGGGKGAVLGGLAGAGGGAAVTMAGDRNAATLPAGAAITARILSPVTVTVDAKEN